VREAGRTSSCHGTFFIPTLTSAPPQYVTPARLAVQAGLLVYGDPISKQSGRPLTKLALAVLRNYALHPLVTYRVPLFLHTHAALPTYSDSSTTHPYSNCVPLISMKLGRPLRTKLA
jgi:hypothetical protein